MDTTTRNRLMSCLSELDYHKKHKGQWENRGNGLWGYTFDYQRTEAYKKMTSEEKVQEDRKNGNFV